MTSTDEVQLFRARRVERLREQLSGQPGVRGGKPRPAPARGSNLLFGVMLHGAARQKAGYELTDLEQVLVGKLGLMLSRAEIDEVASVYQEEASTRAAASVFPDTLVGQPLSDGYGLEHLAKDVPLLREEIRAQSNVAVVDLASAATDGPVDSAEFSRGLAEYGYGTTWVTSSATRPEGRAARGYTWDIGQYRFKTVKESGESGRDEIYWAHAAGADDGTQYEWVTREYGSISTGDDTYFRSGEQGLIRGRVNEYVTLNIACWEADDSPSGHITELHKTLKTIADELHEFSQWMNTYPLPAPEWGDFADYLELASMVTNLINAFIDWIRNDDDLVCQRTLAFAHDALFNLDDSVAWDFDGGGGGRHLLYLSAGWNL